ncbi:MAG: hypothetical protein ACI90U_003133 [Pseudomonadales bacterium]|jgi:hypothetical protein
MQRHTVFMLLMCMSMDAADDLATVTLGSTAWLIMWLFRRNRNANELVRIDQVWPPSSC